MKIECYISLLLALWFLPPIKVNAIPQGASRLTAKEASALFNDALIRGNEGENYIEALEVLSRTKGYKEHMPSYCAKALTHYSWVLQHNGRTELAERVLHEAQNYLTPADSALQYDIKSGLGNCYMRSGEYAKAKKILDELLAYHKQRRMHDKYIADLQNLGTYYNRIKQPGRALHYYRQAQREALARHDWLRVFAINRSLATVIIDNDQKVALMRQTLDIEMRQNLTKLMPQTHYYLSEALYSAQQFDPALKEASLALEGAHEIPESVDSTDVLRLMAEIYAARQNFELSSFYYRQADQRMRADISGNATKIADESRITNDLISWCHDNIVMKPGGKFELKSDTRSAVSTALIVTASLLLLVTILFILAIAYSARRMKKMENDVGYLLLFYNNQNVLLTKIDNLLRQVSGRDAESSTRLRSIRHFIQDNKLDNIQSEYTARQQQQTDRFVDRLTRLYPNLTDTEKQTAVYLWHGLSTREICVLTGNQPRSVNTNRYRLRKSMSLGNDEDLVKHLRSI